MNGYDIPDEDVEGDFHLEPCPLCGGAVELKKYIEHHFIRCPKCELILHAQQYGRDGLDNLVQCWNTRVRKETE